MSVLKKILKLFVLLLLLVVLFRGFLFRNSVDSSSISVKFYRIFSPKNKKSENSIFQKAMSRNYRPQGGGRMDAKQVIWKNKIIF